MATVTKGEKMLLEEKMFPMKSRSGELTTILDRQKINLTSASDKKTLEARGHVANQSKPEQLLRPLRLEYQSY